MSPPARQSLLLQVRRTCELTPRLRRVTLGGASLAVFPQGSAGAHIKLLLPRAGQRQPLLPTFGAHGPVWPPSGLRPIARSYTVAHHDATACELDIDVVLHGADGPAARWAAGALPGQWVGLAGPAGPARCVPGADFYLLAGDPSACPMIAATLADLPAAARGLALIEVTSELDIYPIVHPPGVQLRWLTRGAAPAGASTLLLDAVRELAWPQGTVSATLAGESTQLLALRAHLIGQRHIGRAGLYAVPYWKHGQNEEAYHEERHDIMDQMDIDASAPLGA
jgi:NADPH-dependent ferric siderophore reductase